jgi:hypothetical protein
MSKLRKIVATFMGGLLMGSSASATNISSAKKPIEVKIQKIMKALHAKKMQGIQSKTLIEYLDKNHNLNSIDAEKSKADENEEMNVGNWDTWNNWSNWDTWNNWSNWDTWNNWSNWDTWNTWSNY